MEVTEAMIEEASIRGDVNQLRRWAKRGVRVRSAEPLCQAVMYDMIGAVRILVKDFGADVNQADEEDFTPLILATLEAT
jgi:ankyrin repeat protein